MGWLNAFYEVFTRKFVFLLRYNALKNGATDILQNGGNF